MRTTRPNSPLQFLHLICFLLLVSGLYPACNSGGSGSKGEEDVLASSAPSITISPVVPADIFTNGTPASQATLSQAAAFAWQEFIALNWAAEPGFRDSANAALAFGSDGGKVPLVWHTFRHKVEIYPGNNKPPHGFNDSLPDYGYNTTSPAYFYNPGSTGTPDGQVNPCGTPSANTPWINLDEINEIGVATMFAGAGDSSQYPGQQILFLAKANKSEYVYAAQNGWYSGSKDSANGLAAAKSNTKAYIQANSNTPRPGGPDTLVSFPYGTIEIKTAWRRLTTTEQQSGRFYSTTVRYYTKNAVTNKPCYIDEVFGMVALHIIHKTPTAPYFIFATFEQTDNILTTDGQPVEDSNGNVIANQSLPPLNPDFAVTNATPTTPQTFSPMTANSMPGKSLYYQNVTGEDLPVGTVTINKRLHPIPAEVIAANQSAHAAITAYNKSNNITNSPWVYYKLVNVQYKPLQKAPGVNYPGADSATYYLANSVVESDYILQEFSGKFSSTGFTITDYSGTPPTDTAYNSYYNGKFLMGGCMGCHGNATNGGSDYSFILGNTVVVPEFVQPSEPAAVNVNSAKLRQIRALLNSD
jgi:hypothetical protein